MNTEPGAPRGVPITLVRKGRGAVSNIAHRFESVEREIDAEAHEAERCGPAGADDVPLPALVISTTHETARSLITYNDSPDIGFDRSINPYRGCEHGCIYCFARPSHSYLNLSPGLDFETKLIAKVNAVPLLLRELAAPGYKPRVIAVGVITDAYQPIERELKITRGVIEVLVHARHPFSLITKSSLIERDIDLLTPLAGDGIVGATISITTLDHSLSRILEPRAASPQRRLRTVSALAAAGVPVTVNVAPVIPFINEPEIERILEAAAQAGASQAHYTVLRLPWEVAPLFQQWLNAHFPDRAERVMNRVRDMRKGKNYDSEFGARMTGEGIWAELIRQRFAKAAAKFQLDREVSALRTDLFVARPRVEKISPQFDLF
ncbi:MAG: PA0069 family radical SAM protein [Burkholderiaceae bacterium]|nr:PA0069 family radical SAM protein [Burkholderiaceae bacterium]